MSHKTGKSTLVLPERLLKRIDHLRGTIKRDKFRRAYVDCPKRKYTRILPKSEAYIVREELREYEQDLVALLADLARLFPSLALYEPAHTHVRAAAGVTVVVDIEVKSKVKTGDMVPAYVTVCNQTANEKTVKVTLADTSEGIIIGRRTVTLLPDTSKIVRFDWKTRGFSLGDHILEAEVAAV